MKIGIQIPSFNYAGGSAAIAPRLKDIARFVDENGFHSLWTMDHFFQMEMLGGPDQEMLEGYSTLSYFAALTERVKLGTLVTGVIYRHPGILLKTVTTLDTLSGGRAYLGIGAAWYEQEARGLGVPYPDTSTRFEMLEETLQIAHLAWGSAQPGPFDGKHYQLERPLMNPPPVAQPHPPIMVGGGGEKKTLRLVAQYADACNLFLFAGRDALQKKLDVLKAHCDELGRDYASIEKTALGTISPDMTPADLIALCRSLAPLGFTHLIFNLPDVEKLTRLEQIAREVLPELGS
jgi:F420-dependent oxidoreductase-like protein